MTRIVSFIAGPSAGKSTLAGELFGWMKRQRYNVEYVQEFAKDLTWRDAHDSLDDQLYVLGEQHHRIYTLINKVDWIITDSPLVIQLEYIDRAFSKYKDYDALEDVKYGLINIINYISRIHDQELFFVDRGDRKFVQEGRNQTEEESKQIDKNLLNLLDKYAYPYKIIKSLEDVLKELELEK